MTDSQRRSSTPVQFIRGVGPRRAEALIAAGLHTSADLIRYYPRSYIDRNAAGSLSDIRRKFLQNNIFDIEKNIPAASVSLKNQTTVIARIIKVREHSFGANRKMITAKITDDSADSAEIIFFNNVHYYRLILKEGELIAVSGNPEYDEKYKKTAFYHPEIVRIDDEDQAEYRAGKILPVYMLTQEMRKAGIGLKMIRGAVKMALDEEIAFTGETLSADILARNSLPDIRRAIRTLHFPDSTATLDRALHRMKFEELFFFEMILAMRRRGLKTSEYGADINPKSAKARSLLNGLEYGLTRAQKRALNDFARDFQSGQPMNRLLQGDVGSGKTIVSAFAMLMAVDSGYQALLMAPTEILAEQHYHTLKKLLGNSGVEIVQLVGGQKKKVRTEILDSIALGKANIIVGTHALFGGSKSSMKETEGLRYNNVGLIVIDEQHRFGVMQRAKLKSLATRSLEQKEGGAIHSPHILVMSATPIPRTLAMTLYGDLDVSIIDEMPPGRRPIQTQIVFESQLPEIYEFIRTEIRKGRQAYIVYPLVEISEKIEAKSAVEHYEFLSSEIFPNMKIGLLHGQMLWYEKEDAMKAFKNREYDIMIATTVVEVGIDVPNATIMLIENAERFGLAQLHQLRGRVGRSELQSYCFLATKDHFRYVIHKRDEEFSERKAGVIRLRAMRDTTDGFQIAEIDMKLRGAGNILGTQQSGVPEFQFSDLVSDIEIIASARSEAFALVNRDPHLRSAENEPIRNEFRRKHIVGENLVDIA
ncbi:ATP-dependent DNA helicase RecG [Ignavibacteria bacterium]|nr:ATP-dependent DNA helicase RecG [Bacteroidota bacterium]